MGELTCRINNGGRGGQQAQQRGRTDEAGAREGQPRRLTKPEQIGPAGLDNETYVIGQNLFELAKGRCT
jgi:hypothetical protein